MPDTLTAIAAVARNRVIGDQGRLPWHIPADMRHFRDVTSGGALVMGRATFDSLGGRGLPGRALFVASRGAGGDGPAQVVTWCATLQEAVAGARATGRPVFIAGGEQIYRSAWPLLTDLELTLVDAAPSGDRHFPEVDPALWQETSREPHQGLAFVHYRRRAT